MIPLVARGIFQVWQRVRRGGRAARVACMGRSCFCRESNRDLGEQLVDIVGFFGRRFNEVHVVASCKLLANVLWDLTIFSVNLVACGSGWESVSIAQVLCSRVVQKLLRRKVFNCNASVKE